MKKIACGTPKSRPFSCKAPALLLPLLLLALFGGCDLFDNSMADYFEENTEVVRVVRSVGKAPSAVMEGGIILIPPEEKYGPVEIAAELSNPRNFAVQLEVSNSTEAGGRITARQTGPCEIVVRIEGAVLGENYELMLQMRSPDGLREFDPYTLAVKCVSFEAGLLDLSVNGGAAALDPPFDPNITAYTAAVPYGVTHVILAGRPLNPAAAVTVDGTAGTSKTVGPLSLGDNIFELTVRAENGIDTKTYTVNVVRKADDAKAILSFGITSPVQAQGVIDEAAKTVTINVPPGTNSTDPMITAITHSGASISPASGTAVNFTGPQTYTVSAADGSTQDYIVTVVPGGISGPDDLDKIGSLDFPLDEDYQLNSDITLPDDWTPIGASGGPFTGTFDGDGHTVTITGFDSSAATEGLFGNTDGAEIKNLNIVLGDENNPVTVTQGSAGGVAGSAKKTTLENVTVTGNMVVSRNAGGEVGGLVGKFEADATTNRLYRCAANVNITANLSGRGDVGGLVGKLEHNSNASIVECYSTGDINITLQSPSMLFAGGLAGMIDEYGTQITITNSYATGDVSASMSSSPSEMCLGGLVGQLRGSSKTVEYCYASGTVSSPKPVGSAGGLCGEVYSGSTVQNSAALSPAVSGGEDARRHRVAGHLTGTFTNNIANSAMIITINSAPLTGDADNVNGLDKNPADLQSQPTYTALGWDFGSVWKMDSSVSAYPILQWQD